MRSILPLATLAALVPLPSLEAQGLKPPTLLEGMAPDDDELDLRTTPVVRAVQRAENSVVSIYLLAGDHVEGLGSGVIIDECGFVITNWHVIFPAQVDPSGRRIEVRLKNDRKYTAKLISSSPEHDLALLQLELAEDERVEPVDTGRSDSLMIGETVLAIGNPQGHANTVTVGVLSAIDRGITVRAPDGKPRRYDGLLQTDAAINQGNSGGALLDITGKLVGINNAMAQGVENIGFAIPVDTVRSVFKDVLLSSENLSNVWIGMTIAEEGDGVVIERVTPRGPAATAGLRAGDRIEKVMGRAVGDRPAFMTQVLARLQAGDEITIDVERRGKDQQTSLEVLSAVERDLALQLGLEVERITADKDPELARHATRAILPNERRVLPATLRVRRVHEGSSAAEIGVQEGDLILGTRVRSRWGMIRNFPFVTRQSLMDYAFRAGNRGMDLLVMRGGDVLEGEIAIESP